MIHSIMMRLIFVCVVLLAVCFGEKPNSNGFAATSTEKVAFDKSSKTSNNTDLDADTDTEEVVQVSQQFTVNVIMEIEPTADDLRKMEESLTQKFLEDLASFGGGTSSSTVRVVITVEDVKTFKVKIEVFVENAEADNIEILSENVDTVDELIPYISSNSATYSFNLTSAVTGVTVDAPVAVSFSPTPSVSPSASAAVDDDDDDLSDGALVGIILGVGVGGVGLASLACYLVYGKKKETDEYVDSDMADATL